MTIPGGGGHGDRVDRRVTHKAEFRVLQIRVEETGVVRLSGRFDASEADAALDALNGVTGPVVADLGELDYISSAGLSVLVQTYKRLHRQGHSLHLVNPRPRVREIITYAGLDQLLGME